MDDPSRNLPTSLRTSQTAGQCSYFPPTQNESTRSRRLFHVKPGNAPGKTNTPKGGLHATSHHLETGDPETEVGNWATAQSLEPDAFTRIA